MASVVVLVGQALQAAADDVWPAAMPYRPKAQPVHAVALAGPLAKVPNGHGEHASPTPVLKLPLPHA